MRDFRDAKAMAQTLRAELAPKGAVLSHSECLEITAKIFGAKDWNILSAAIDRASDSSAVAAVDRWSGPLILIRDFVLFPKQTAPLFVGREMSKKALAEARRGGFEVLLVAQKEAQEDHPRRDGIYDVGVVADVLEVADATADDLGTKPAEGTMKLTMRGRQRAKIVAVVDDSGRRHAKAQLIQSKPEDEAIAAEQVRAAIEAFKAFAANAQVRGLSADLRSRLMIRAENITQPGALADLIAQLAPSSVAKKQSVLETDDELLRLEAAVALLKG
ncbi:LON peptidase substrate-binding domain-containing protein [Rhodoplanes sp. Z2-YC6860]|uniref:LON peptidase substrate-binding domain-containing protein n=1 Tax=Rhodoplanes sp. Z2-YC6860 TaxID=674703 RepID=UPI00078B299F|nr:LON peptidase substrate-binding domain-containing protein [Rhodoplanes sp. Z2-YC6860]AMN42834.1 endopeptidase La [Rhodoplanes sp. Z2-YC6860]